jgi:ATP-binding cassette subfamily B multidrug efflux pump
MRHDHLIDEVEAKAFDRQIMGRLLGYLAPYRWWIALAITILLGSSLFVLVGPFLVKVAIDDCIRPRNPDGLDRIALLYFGALLGAFLLRYLQTILTYWIGQRAMLDLRMEVFSHIERQSLSFFDRHPVGQLMTRVGSDVEVLQEMLSMGVITIFGDIFILLGIVIAMIAINWRLALVSFVVLPVLFWVTILFRKRVRQSFRVIRKKVSAMNAFLNEHLSGIVVVKLFNREKAAAAHFGRINDEHRQAFLKAIFYYAVFFPAVEVIGAVAIALLLGYGGFQILAGAMTFGALVAFIEYLEKFYRPVQDLAEKYNILQSAMAASERIFAILDTEPEITDRPDPVPLRRSRGEITFRNVHFAYQEGAEVIRDVSFAVEPSEMVALVGATGAGKTSIISLLTRLYEPQGGSILLDGRDIREYSQVDLRRQMAVVLQDVFLFSGTVRENISLGNEEISADMVEEAARRVQADDFIRKLPKGYETEVGERGAILSVGQKQLLSFARALAHDPPILILDEATSSVDAETEALIQEALDVLFAGRTSIVIAHRLSTIMGSDRIITIHKGKIRETGTHRELIRLEGVYSKLYRMQYAGVSP